jgi:hypothetical protein
MVNANRDVLMDALSRTPSKSSIIYLANPYSHPDPEVQAARYREALRVTAELTRMGYVVFSPIVHSHPLHVSEGVAGDWNFWKFIDFEFIRNAGALMVVPMPGYRESRGVTEEIEYAVKIGIPVVFYEGAINVGA